jgi:hypothetical protein
VPFWKQTPPFWHGFGVHGSPVFVVPLLILTSSLAFDDPIVEDSNGVVVGDLPAVSLNGRSHQIPLRKISNIEKSHKLPVNCPRHLQIFL